MELATGEAPDTPPDSNSELSRFGSSGRRQEAPTLDSPTDSRFSVQPSPLSEALDSMRSLAITEGSFPNYAHPRVGAESGEFYVPPTTHFIATVEDLTDMLDYGSKDIDGMDDDAREEQAENPPFTGHWMATSSYDVYMVDTPKEGDDDNEKNVVEDKPPEIQPKRQQRRSKSHHGRDNNTGTRDNNTLDDAEDQENPVEPTSEQDDREDG